jgi:hypothetical protein
MSETPDVPLRRQSKATLHSSHQKLLAKKLTNPGSFTKADEMQYRRIVIELQRRANVNKMRRIGEKNAPNSHA